MILFMVRDAMTGLYYKRIQSLGSTTCWVEQEEASVWTTLAGARACLGAITRFNDRLARFGPAAIRKPEVVRIYATPAVQTPTEMAVTFVDADDWEGLYIDGKLVVEAHHLRLQDIFCRLGVKVTFLPVDQEWLEERGSLPTNIEDVKQQ